MVLCEHCESGIKYLPHWVLLKKVNDFGQLYYLPQTLHCPIAVLSETCALASRPELLDPMELMLRGAGRQGDRPPHSAREQSAPGIIYTLTGHAQWGVCECVFHKPFDTM